MHRPVLIGVCANPLWRKGGDREYALYPAPDGCTGYRLYEHDDETGAMRIDYINTFDRRDPIAGSAWVGITNVAEMKRQSCTPSFLRHWI